MAHYSITFSAQAKADIRYEGRRAEVLVTEAAERHLGDALVPVPGQEGQRKVLDANPLGAAYRLRVGEWRA